MGEKPNYSLGSHLIYRKEKSRWACWLMALVLNTGRIRVLLCWPGGLARMDLSILYSYSLSTGRFKMQIQFNISALPSFDFMRRMEHFFLKKPRQETQRTRADKHLWRHVSFLLLTLEYLSYLSQNTGVWVKCSRNHPMLNGFLLTLFDWWALKLDLFSKDVEKQ